MWPFDKTQIKESATIDINYKPTISFENNFVNTLTEQFKGEVEKKDIKFPADLGEEHPFDFLQLEELYKKFGFYTAVIDKYVDFVVGPGFYIKCEDERAKTIIEDFMEDVNFDTLLRAWTKEALNKGNGFLEIGGSKKKGVKGLKVLNANYMYVNRDKFGKVEGYKQYKGAFDKFAKEKVVDFKPDSIAHFPFNIVGDCAYGIGIGYPALKLIDDWLSQQKSLHKLMDRKANAPLHAQLGKVDGNVKIIPKPEDVAAFGKELETMTNKTEWATDALVNFKVIDFGNFGEKFGTILDNDLYMLFYTFQIPPELMGMANIPEGMASVRIDAFQRRIQSIQAELEKIIEQQIFKRVLNANGFDIHVEFEWGTPSTIAVEGRMKLITELITSPTTSTIFRDILEKELVNLLKLDLDEYEEAKAEEDEERKREEERPIPIVPGQNAGFPQEPVPKAEQPPQPKPEEKLKKNFNKIKENTEAFEEVNDIGEWLGFAYKKYLGHIHTVLMAYDFNQIKALTEAQATAGYLSSGQVEQVRGILDKGLLKGSGMKEIAKQMDKKVGLKDLYRMTAAGEVKTGASGLPILAKSADKRSIGIVRSEITRMANAGAIKYYKENGIDRVRWVSSYGPRTCPECEALNGQIFTINKQPNIPLHSMCRCTLSPVVELT